MAGESNIVNFLGQHWMLAGFIICLGGWAYMSRKIKRRKTPARNTRRDHHGPETAGRDRDPSDL